MARHSGPARAARLARGTYCDPSHSSPTATTSAHSPRPKSLAVDCRSSLSTARLTRHSPSHLQLPSVSRRGPPRAVTVVTRRGPPSLAAARLNKIDAALSLAASRLPPMAQLPAFARHSLPHCDSPLSRRQSRSLGHRSDLEHPHHHISNTQIARLRLFFIT